MNDVTQTRIASILTAGIGVWLLLLPLFVTVSGGALASTLIAGGVLALAGVVQLFWENTIPSWISGLAAAWLAFSAFVFTMADGLFWNTTIAAVAALLLAMWDGIEVDKVAERHHTHA
jgi:hypothetical protein